MKERKNKWRVHVYNDGSSVLSVFKLMAQCSENLHAAAQKAQENISEYEVQSLPAAPVFSSGPVEYGFVREACIEEVEIIILITNHKKLQNCI